MLFACKCLNVSLLAPAAATTTASGNHGPNSGRTLADALVLQLQQQQQSLLAKPTSEQMQFLQKALGPLESVRVTVRQPDLVRTSQLGGADVSSSLSWRLDQCIGCDMWTHATNRSGQLVLINPETMTNDEDIKYLESTANYSKTFGVLLNQSTRDQQFTSSDMAAARQKAPETFRSEQLRHKRLQQHFRDAVQREIEATDERIRSYTEQQFAQLRAFREHAAAEYQTLVRLALSVPETAASLPPQTIATATTTTATAALASAKVLLDTTPPATPDSTPMSIGNSPNFGRPPPGTSSGATASPNVSLLASSLSAQRAIPFKSKTSPLRNTTTPPTQLAQSYGGGGVIEQAVDAFFFEMDGAVASGPAAASNVGGGYAMLSHSNSYMSDVEESDSDDSTDNPSDGLAIPRSQIRPKSLSIAQSMPISMPACNELRSSEADDDDYDEYAGNLDDGVDIAASIKALAKSVHGDAVFGDLPRPRFSTQI